MPFTAADEREAVAAAGRLGHELGTFAMSDNKVYVAFCVRCRSAAYIQNGVARGAALTKTCAEALEAWGGALDEIGRGR